MSKAISLSHSLFAEARQYQRDVANSAIVVACGTALILAGQPFPL